MSKNKGGREVRKPKQPKKPNATLAGPMGLRTDGTAERRSSAVRIAMLAPVAWRTPPRHYGPWEQVTGLLTEGLVARGVEVTLFATLDSVTSAALDGVCPHGYAEDPELDGRVWEALHVSTRWPGRTDSTWCTTRWTGCRWPSTGTRGRRC